MYNTGQVVVEIVDENESCRSWKMSQKDNQLRNIEACNVFVVLIVAPGFVGMIVGGVSWRPGPTCRLFCCYCCYCEKRFALCEKRFVVTKRFVVVVQKSL